MRNTAIAVGLALAGSLLVAAVVVAFNRPVVLTGTPLATTSSGTTPAILTSGDGIVAKKPDLAVVGAGVEAQASTASAAQSDLAAKAAKLIARIKSLPTADQDLNTTGYWIGPVYSPGGQTITGYRAAEQLQVKWHNADSVGRVLDAIVQEGGATNIYVSFGLNDPKAAQAEARTLAITEARAKAQAMANAAGVKLGQVLRVSDVSSSSRGPLPLNFGAADVKAPTQVPVGELDVQVTVEVDFAIA
jgi:uncharacterized protein